MYFVIRRRNGGRGKALVVETGFATREEAKPTRDKLNADYYAKKEEPVPDNNREFFISRSAQHRHGPSK